MDFVKKILKNMSKVHLKKGKSMSIEVDILPFYFYETVRLKFGIFNCEMWSISTVEKSLQKGAG